jgi:2-oxoglutarate dehydrogenase E2 component (dihydrolipoamide succinyltransferase)
MPNLDLTVTEATVVRWLKRVGDSVALNEEVVEVETDKAVLRVESPAAGSLAEILVPERGIVRLGEALGTVRPASAGRAGAPDGKEPDR